MNDAERIATDLWAVARRDEQSARLVPDDGLAAQIRAHIRQLAAADGIRVRTARSGDTVLVVRLDAKLWSESTATMRAKLSPPPDDA